LLSLLERAAVGQSEGETLGHGPTAERLKTAKALGSARILLIRDPIERIMSRYWFEGRWNTFKTPTNESAVSIEDWLQQARGRAKGTRVWTSVENYYVKTLASCGGVGVACKTEQQQSSTTATTAAAVGAVGGKELEIAKNVLEKEFTLVLLTEWLGSEAQRRLVASELCFEWPRPVLRNRQGEMRAVPELTPKRAAGGHSATRPAAGWEVPSNPQTYARLLRENSLDLELFQYASQLVKRRVHSTQGAAMAAALPRLNVTEKLQYLRE